MMWHLFRRSWVGKTAPAITGTDWFNKAALPRSARNAILRGDPVGFAEELAGYVVVLDFWDYSCITCINSFPYLQEWWRRYKHLNFLIIGVHTPEFEFARDPEKVENAILRFELFYPIVSDADYATWKRYNNDVWPRKLVVDPGGVIRHDRRGEGGYQEMEGNIQELLKEVHPIATFSDPLPILAPTDDLTAARLPATPATRLGWRQGTSANSGGLRPDEAVVYTLPASVPLHGWALGGHWKAQGEDLIHEGDGAADLLLLHYLGTEVFAVMRSRDGKPVQVAIEQDGKPLAAQALGADVTILDNTSTVTVTDDRLYRLVKNPQHGEHQLLVRPRSGKLALHTFTFGTSTT